MALIYKLSVVCIFRHGESSVFYLPNINTSCMDRKLSNARKFGTAFLKSPSSFYHKPVTSNIIFSVGYKRRLRILQVVKGHGYLHMHLKQHTSTASHSVDIFPSCSLLSFCFYLNFYATE